MGVDRLFLQNADARFRIGLLGDAARSLAPMVKNFRDMPDPGSALTQAQHELKILDPIVGGIETSLLRQFAFHAKEVTHIHGAPKIFRRPIGLKEWLDESAR